MGEKLDIPSENKIQSVLKLDTVELPSFTPVMSRLLEICNDPLANMGDIAKLVETDVGLSTNILRIVNSAFYGLRRKITAISEAVLYLGLDEVKKICLGVTVFEKMIKPKSGKHFDRIFFWRHCLCVASLSQSIAAETEYINPAEAYSVGLLHDFGKIIFDVSGRVSYGGFVTRSSTCIGHLVDNEREIMGMGHDDLGAYYSAAWKLPDALSLVIKSHHRQFDHMGFSDQINQLISIVSLANFIAWSQGMGSLDVIYPPALQPEIEKILLLDKIDFKKIVQKMDEEIENTARFYRFEFPSSNQFRENLLKTNLKLSSINASHYFQSETAGQNQADIEKITESLTAPHRSLEPKTIIENTLKAICTDFNFDRIYVMRMAKPKRHLYVSECMEFGKLSDRLASVQIPMDKKSGGFIQCLRKRGPVLITGKTPGEKKALDDLGVDELLIVPFTNKNKVVGILGMDLIASSIKVESSIFNPIGIVANELGIALENASAYKEARSVSLHDGLTGLLNRLAIDRLLRKCFRNAVEGEIDLSLVMIDVDYFKKFNDQFGHQSGDGVLKLISKTLKKLSRPFDHVGRYGGEEFIVVLNNTDIAKARIYAERIRKEIERLGKLLSDRFPGLPLTVSIGVSQYQEGMKNQDILISIADKALYQAKNSGRNQIAG